MEISIHVLREEDDPWKTDFDKMAMNFYPRPPRGEDPWNPHFCMFRSNFLPTPRRGSTTRHHIFGGALRRISIHVLREEDDA